MNYVDTSDIDPESERLLSGLYSVQITNWANASLGGVEASYFLDNFDEEITKENTHYIKCAKSIINISNLVMDGFDVKIVKQEQILNIYERVEHYLRNYANYFGNSPMSERAMLKKTLLDNLAKSMFNKNKELFIKLGKKEETKNTGFYKLSTSSETKPMSIEDLDEYTRGNDKLNFSDEIYKEENNPWNQD